MKLYPTWIAADEVLILVMAAGVNYNGVWAALGTPVSPIHATKILSTLPVPMPPASSGLWVLE